MGYTIKNFIDSNKFQGLQLISDNSGINREIKGDLDHCSSRYGKIRGGRSTAPDISGRLRKIKRMHDAKPFGRIK